MAPLTTGAIRAILQEFSQQRVGRGRYATAGGGSGITATGGVISDYSDPGPGAVYRAHIFTSSGTFDVTSLSTNPALPDTIEYLVVAGGGSGSGYGGGGAGGLRTNLSGHPLSAGNPSFSVSTTGGNGSGSYTITIGSGGSRGVGGTNADGSTRGNPSYFGPPTTPNGITATAGGIGGKGPSYGTPSDMNGGSGGGAGYAITSDFGYGLNPSTPAPEGGPSSWTEGFPGGVSGNPSYSGGGGGGAGGAGTTGSPSPAAGGPGVQVAIAGPPIFTGVGALNPGPGQYQWFAGGGGGGSYPPAPDVPATGGVGGGGPGGRYPSRAGVDGTYATGGGGGASGEGPNSGAGGSGIVVVRYQIGQLTAAAKATGGAISYYGGKTIHTFTSSGTFATAPNWSATNVEYVVVGGGGAGNGGQGPSAGGGGGAGGFITNTNHPIGTHPVSVTVQVGGGAAASPNTQVGGTPSYFGTPITAYGGGGGGRHINGGGNPFENGQPGGSGGGECDSQGPIGAGLGSRQTGTTTPTPITPQGNPGGDGAGNGGINSVAGGGGGGAGQAGQNATDQGPGGDGGYGKQLPSTFQNPASATSLGTSPNPTRYAGPNSGNYWFAGGGGGASSTPPSAFGLDTQGGLGGGGRGFTNPADSLPTARGEMDAVQNTGGGGGAFHGPAGGAVAGFGGSGIVIIAYPS
jgi:hypothetical protein